MFYNIDIEIQEVLIMKYAIVNGNRTHISKVKRGTVGREFGYRDILVKACKGKHKQYWKHISKTTYIYH
jgi:hypothetical protein